MSGIISAQRPSGVYVGGIHKKVELLTGELSFLLC